MTPSVSRRVGFRRKSLLDLRVDLLHICRVVPEEGPEGVDVPRERWSRRVKVTDSFHPTVSVVKVDQARLRLSIRTGSRGVVHPTPKHFGRSVGWKRETGQYEEGKESVHDLGLFVERVV